MQAAKKLVLVDEFDREYKRLQRPTIAVAKTDRSLQLSDTLHSQSIADDQKVREYVAALCKYLNTHEEVPEEPEVEPNLGTFAPLQLQVRQGVDSDESVGGGAHTDMDMVYTTSRLPGSLVACAIYNAIVGGRRVR